LRKAARESGVDVLVYEGGEGLRSTSLRFRRRRCIANVMLQIGMLELPDGAEPPPRGHGRDWPVFVDASKWVRAPEGGVLRTTKRIGDAVSEGDVIGFIANPYEDQDAAVRAPRRGLIIGRTTLPIVNRGDALFHIAWSEELAASKVPVRDKERGRGRADPDGDEII
jgi:predicted deacylase